MKTQSKKVGWGVFLSMFFIAIFTLQASETNFGTYKVEKTNENVLINNVSVEKFVIEYSNLDKPVCVMIVLNKKSVHYIVRTDGFELEYLYKNNKFGVAFLDSEFATMKKQDVQKKINRKNFLYQKVISSGDQSDEYRLNLIACYLPELIMEN